MANSLIFWTIKNRGLKEIFFRVIDLLGYLLIPIAFFMPRNKNKWVFGNKTGYNDNPKYLISYIKENKPSIRPIWISHVASDRDQVIKHGIEVYNKWSLRGIWHCLTAKVYIFSGSASDINYWTSYGAIKVNLWHGVGIKKLGLKGSVTYNPKDKLNKFLTPSNYDKPTYFITTSDLMQQHFCDCYSLDKHQTPKIGYPRCDFLQENKAIISDYIEKYETPLLKELYYSLKKYKYIYIYMPTFRDDQQDFMKSSGISFDELNSLMKLQDALFLLKLHPATRIDFSSAKYSNIKIVDKSIDIYPILPYTDVLITDYSSIYYDYQLMPDKHIILFPFDYENYISHSRDLAFDYDTYTPGLKVSTWEELKKIISNTHLQEPTKNQWVIEHFWGQNFENASEKIVELICNSCNI